MHQSDGKQRYNTGGEKRFLVWAGECKKCTCGVVNATKGKGKVKKAPLTGKFLSRDSRAGHGKIKKGVGAFKNVMIPVKKGWEEGRQKGRLFQCSGGGKPRLEKQRRNNRREYNSPDRPGQHLEASWVSKRHGKRKKVSSLNSEARRKKKA